jgi:hypothetical protein
MSSILTATARGVPVRLTAGSLFVGERRFLRHDIRGVEFDRGPGRGCMVLTGADGVVARIDFLPAERRGLLAIEKALAPRRKSLVLYIDREAYRPGEVVRGHVELDWPRTTPVRGVRVGFLGAERTEITVSSGSGKNRRSTTYREHRPLVSREIDLFGGPPVGWWRATGEALNRLVGVEGYPRLLAGRHRWDFEFRLPEDALPSFVGTYAEVSYLLYAQVDIPMGFDVTTEGVVAVLPPEGARLAGCRGRAERSGVLKADVDMRLETDACPLEAGVRLPGRIVVRNRSTKRIRGVTVRLLAVEEAEAEGRRREAVHELNEGYLPTPDPSSPRQDVTFEIPVNGPFPYEGAHSRLAYRLEWTLDTAMGFDTTVAANLEVLTN